MKKTIYEKFNFDFCKKVSELVIGDPFNSKTEFGAITSKAQYEKILDYIRIAKEQKGKILFGGNVVKMKKRCEKGWFIEPTVVDGLHSNSELNKEEIFGPIVTIQPFSSEEEAVNLANNTKYGLSASIWTDDIGKANRVSRKIESGVIWLNCWLIRDLRTPFGGVKNSGYGKEEDLMHLDFLLNKKIYAL